MTPKYSDLPAASAQTAFRRIIWGTVHSGSESSCNNLLLQSSDIRLRHSTAALRSDPDGCRAAIEAKGFVAKVPELPRYQNRNAFVLHVLEISALALETKAEFPQGEDFVDLHHIYQTVRHSRKFPPIPITHLPGRAHCSIVVDLHPHSIQTPYFVCVANPVSWSIR